MNALLLLKWYAPRWEVVPGLSAYDALVGPLYMAIILAIGYFIKSHVAQRNPMMARYLMPALVAKMLGALAFAYVYVYYYTYGGDTFYYYTLAQPVVDAFRDSLYLGWKFILIPPGTFTEDTFPYAADTWHFFQDGKEDLIHMGRIIGFIEAYLFRSYWLTTLVISALSMTGLWQFFRLFYGMAPQDADPKLLAIGTFFIPSVLFWGSGIMKDTVCIGLLGWVAYGGDRILQSPAKNARYLPLIVFAGYHIYILKSYILLAYLPVFALSIYTKGSANEYISAIKKVTAPLSFALLALAFVFGIGQLANSSEYSLDGIEQKMQGFHSYHATLAKTQGQSFYSLGEVSYTPAGILAKAPAAINVTYFRPYPWEVNEPLQYLSALESFLTLMVFFYLFYQHGFLRVLRKLFTGQLLPYTVFVLFFGLSVGITAYNFGALVRFKVPGYLVLANVLALAHLHLTAERKEAYTASMSETSR